MPRNALCAVLLIVSLASCAAPPVEAPREAPPAVPAAAGNLGKALVAIDRLGLRLGMTEAQVRAVVPGICTTKGHYNAGTGPATELLCLVPVGGTAVDRGLLRLAMSSPEAGHRVWRIDYERRQGEGAGSSVVQALRDRYGPPRAVHVPLEMWWRAGGENLRLIGEPKGLRIQVWDRSLNEPRASL